MVMEIPFNSNKFTINADDINKVIYIDASKLGSEGACNNCKRPLVTKDMLTKNGCIWCDAEYHQKEKNK